MATGTNAQLLTLSGKRNPYPGKLGVVEQGALADLLLVDGDPIANIKLIEDPAKNFVVIMKGGKISRTLCRLTCFRMSAMTHLGHPTRSSYHLPNLKEGAR